MNINKLGLYSNINNINRNKDTSIQDISAKSSHKTPKTDIIDIAHRITANPISEAELTKMRVRILNQLQSPADTARINRLRQQIQKGDYKLDSTEIARSILV
ncbi:MAG TPA: flagellar biosynthesis anti-sigma factor FlgM [Clostridiales bacterium]|nr:flagellar biosynthesis anti-sigma factor FlgM [Clostridiales bacterium]